MKYIFRKSIWAVGQGGFSMGTLYNELSTKRLYTYVYDCGTDQLRTLRREIDGARTHFADCENEKIDIAFLSHLDADHVNGFDTLCESFNRKIDKVVLPYLDLDSRYYIAAAAMAEKSATGLFLEFIVDPVKWIRARLPSSEIILLGPPPEGEMQFEAPEFPTNPVRPNQVDSNLQKERLQIEVKIRTSPSNLKSVYKDLPQYRWVAIEPKVIGQVDAPILLLAHIPPRSNEKLNAFRNALKAAGFNALSVTGLKKIIANAKDRETLKECYLTLASDHNIVSIHLLVKSLCPNHKYLPANSKKNLWHHFISSRMSFLFSGDAKLSTKIYFNDWRNFYSAHLADVALFSLPHHGSKLSFEPRLLNALPKAAFVAQAGANGYEHPSPEVTDQLRAAGRKYHQVDASGQSRIDVEYELS